MKNNMSLRLLLADKDKEIEKLEALVECLYKKVPLNEEEEKLLDKILFGGNKK